MRWIVHLLGNCSAPVLIGCFMHLIHTEPPDREPPSRDGDDDDSATRRGDDDGNFGGGSAFGPAPNATAATDGWAWACDAGCAHRAAFRLVLAVGALPAVLVALAGWAEVRRRAAELRAQELADTQADTRRAARKHGGLAASAHAGAWSRPSLAAGSTSTSSSSSSSQGSGAGRLATKADADERGGLARPQLLDPALRSGRGSTSPTSDDSGLESPSPRPSNRFFTYYKSSYVPLDVTPPQTHYGQPPSTP
jgi:hypothetical protein